MSSTRQLAAIMFTDIVGYTAMMGKDSQKALELVRQSREIQKPLVEKFNGKWLKEMGDGAMAQFNTALDAVNCAIEIQRASRADFEADLRIGIHLGDITIEENDIYGDGVNIAARLESIADPGGIYISDAIWKSIQGQSELQVKELGEISLKNVAYQVRAYAFQGVGLPVPKKKLKSGTFSVLKPRTTLIFALILAGIAGAYFIYNVLTSAPAGNKAETIRREKTIAVMPFENLSNDPEQQYFADGIMEEILTDLFKFGDLHVTSRTSAMSYKGLNKKTTEIGKELNVAYLLEGSVRKSGEMVRITVQLIDAFSDQHLWAENYDGEMKDIFAFQSKVAGQIATELNANISPQIKNRLGTVPTTNSQAYDLFLHGREQINLMYLKFETPILYKAIDYYTEALALDPDYSNAYAGLSHAYWVMAQFSPDYDTAFWTNSKKYAEKAIELDPSNGYAYQNLANVQYKWEGDKEGAEYSYLKSVELDPGNFQFQNNINWFYLRIDDCDKLETQAEVTKQFQLHGTWDFFIPLCRRDLDKIRTLDPYDFDAHGVSILNYQEKYNECIKYLTEENPLPQYNIVGRTILGEAYAYSGDTLKAMELIKTMQELSKNQYISEAYFVPIYLALGKKEKAFEILEKVVDDPADRWALRSWKEFFVSIYRIQDDPHYKELMARSWK